MTPTRKQEEKKRSFWEEEPTKVAVLSFPTFNTQLVTQEETQAFKAAKTEAPNNQTSIA